MRWRSGGDIPFVRFDAGIMVCIFGRSGAFVLLGIVVSHGEEWASPSWTASLCFGRRFRPL